MTDNMDELDKYTATCPFEKCDWESHITPIFDDDIEDRLQKRQEEHYFREHTGTARVKVTLEKEVSVQPGQSLQSIVDSIHDSTIEQDIRGFEVAYAVGELTEKPSGDLDD